MSTLNTESLLFEEKQLFVPQLKEICEVLSRKLCENFEYVSVEIVECPNLQEEPYRLAASGLGGSPTLIEVGGPPYLLPSPDRTKVYNMKEIVQKSLKSSNSDILAIGAGAGPFPVINSNCEGIYNMKISSDGNVHNQSYIAKVDGPEEQCIAKQLDPSEMRSALLVNLFACHGEKSDVLKVSCKKRIGPLNYIESIRLILTDHFADKAVGLGGIFLLKKGKAKQHVMRDFSKTPIDTEEQLNKWLKFYEMPATLNAVGTLVTQEMDLDLRLQHFHSFSNTNWAGHYHYDTTPEEVEYEGFFTVAERVVRVDKPINTHNYGRD